MTSAFTVKIPVFLFNTDFVLRLVASVDLLGTLSFAINQNLGSKGISTLVSSFFRVHKSYGVVPLTVRRILSLLRVTPILRPPSSSPKSLIITSTFLLQGTLPFTQTLRVFLNASGNGGYYSTLKLVKMSG